MHRCTVTGKRIEDYGLEKIDTKLLLMGKRVFHSNSEPQDRIIYETG